MSDTVYQVQTDEGGVYAKTGSSYNDAYDLAKELRDNTGMKTYVVRCEVINHFDPPEEEDETI